MRKGLVIFLHGVGSNGDDLAGLGEHWAPLLQGVSFAAPDAPFHFEHGAGFQWFSLQAITEQNRPGRVLAAREAFDQQLRALLQAHSVTEDRVILVGFSQGSIMALDALASGRWQFAGVVAFSGRLATSALSPCTTTPALIVHGQDDDVIPWMESEAAALRLKGAGVHVETQFEPATGHTISGQGARRAATFIAQCLHD